MRPGIFLFLLALAGAFATGPAAAQPHRAPGVQPLDRILPGIRRSHPGQFYDADGPTPGPGGSQHYHLKWMTPDGRIEWLDTDARTGRVLGASPGRDAFDGPGPERYYAPAPSYPAPQAFPPPGYYGGRGAFGGGPESWRGGFGREPYDRGPYAHDGGPRGGYGGGRGGWHGGRGR